MEHVQPVNQMEHVQQMQQVKLRDSGPATLLG